MEISLPLCDPPSPAQWSKSTTWLRCHLLTGNAFSFKQGLGFMIRRGLALSDLNRVPLLELIGFRVYDKKRIVIMGLKVTTPNCDLFAKLTFTNFCLKCTSFFHEGVESILDTPNFNTFKNHSYFIHM